MNKRPSPNIGPPVLGTDGQTWFEQFYGNPNFDTAKSVSFAKPDLQELVNQPRCDQLILSKQKHNNWNTLAIAGIDDLSFLQVGPDHLVLVGTYFITPRSDTKIVNLNFSSMQGAKILGESPQWDTEYSSSGEFNTVISAFQKKPDLPNHFSTVNFRLKEIQNLLKPEVDKVAFISGYVTLTHKFVNSNTDSFHLLVHTKSQLETLIAVAVDAQDNAVEGLDPVIPSYPWPVRWKPYA